jgi:RHS repeat-associated protein
MVYNPYGEVFLLNPDWTEQLGTPLVPWQHLFQGLKFTEATGLGYVRNRDYSPTLGRFIELDPIGFDAGDNNWYRFVGNGSVGKVDPSGLCFPCDKAMIQHDNQGLEKCLDDVQTKFDALYIRLKQTRDAALQGLDDVQRRFYVNCINGFQALGQAGSHIDFICDQRSWAARDEAEDLAQRLFRTAVIVNFTLAYFARNECYSMYPCADAGVRAWGAAPPGPGGAPHPLRTDQQPKE